MDIFTDAFWTEQVTAIKAQITKLNSTISDLSCGAIISYTLDTGQSRQTVTKVSIEILYAERRRLMNELACLDARINGSGSSYGAAGF